MKKMLLLFTMAAAVLSCSDDGGTGGPKLPRKVTMSGGMDEIYRFSYDAQDRIRQIKRDGSLDFTLDIVYNNEGKIYSIIDPEGGYSVFVQYDTSGRPSEFLRNDVSMTVTYDSDANQYVYGNGFMEVFSLTSGNELSLGGEATYDYDPVTSGPFASAMSDYYVLSLVVDQNLAYFLTKKALVGITYNGELKDVAHIADDQGYPHTTTVAINGNALIAIEYQY